MNVDLASKGIDSIEDHVTKREWSEPPLNDGEELPAAVGRGGFTRRHSARPGGPLPPRSRGRPLTLRSPADVPAHPDVVDAARRRYLEDELHAHRYHALTQRHARQHPVAMTLEWVNSIIAGMWHGMVNRNMRWDEVVLGQFCAQVPRVYHKVSTFLWTHVLLVVGKKTRRIRRAHCATCTYCRYDDGTDFFGPWFERVGQAHCFGRNRGEGCGCWMTWWWFFARLWWMLALRNFVCPVGKFGRFDGGSPEGLLCDPNLEELPLVKSEAMQAATPRPEHLQPLTADAPEPPLAKESNGYNQVET